MHVLQSRVLVRPGDFTRSVAFYEQGIGLVRYREWGEPPHRGVVYFVGGGYLELTEGGGGSRGRPTRFSGDVGEIPLVRVWLQVADLDATHQELTARSIEIADGPRLMPWGLIEMRVHDPDGLELVIIETPSTHPLRRRP